MLNRFDSLLLYFLVYFLSALFISISKKTERGANKFVYLLGIIGPILLAAFRYKVGTDYNNYHLMYNIYTSMSAEDFFTSRELFYGWGIWIVCKVSKLLGGEQTFFGILAFLIIHFGIKAFERYESVNWFLIVFAYLLGPFSTGLNTVKQAVAMAVIFWGIKFVYEEKLIKFLLCVLLAVMFHTTAIVAIPIYFVYNSEADRIWNIRSVFSALIAVIASVNLLNVLSVISKVDFMNISRFSGYSSEGTANLTFILILFEFIVILLFQNKLSFIDEKNKLLIVLMGLGLCVNLTGFISVFVKRISSYFTSYSLLVLFSQLPKAVPQYRYNKLICEIIISVFFITVFVLYYYFRGQGNIIPYSFKL